MTDEEKAEKYVKENCCEFCVNKYDCEMGWIDCHTKEGVLYGLAEGRKEKCLEQNNDGTIRPCEVMKENEQLKERIREAENDSNNCEHWSYTRIKQLEEQIEQLSNDNHVLKTSFITQQEQIEKMKCCQNCRFFFSGGCRKGIDGCWCCNKWELTE